MTPYCPSCHCSLTPIRFDSPTFKIVKEICLGRGPPSFVRTVGYLFD